MKYGIREICNVVFKAKTARKIGSKTFEAGQPVIYFDSLKTSTLEQATTTVYAQGGRGNTRLVAWEGEKTLTFTMEDALISPMGLAILAGAKLYDAKAENTLVVHVTETIANGKVTKKPTVAIAEGNGKTQVVFYALELDKNGEITGEPKEVTIATEKADGGYAVTDKSTSKPLAEGIYLIDYYTDIVGAGSYQIDIEPQVFGGNFYIEADTLFRDGDGADHPAQFIIPNGKIQSNFTFTMASSGDPSTFTFTVDAFPGHVNNDTTKKVLSSIQVLNDTEATEGNDDAAGDYDGTATQNVTPPANG